MSTAQAAAPLARPRAILFDLDGTLVDSHASIEHCVRHALASRGLAFDEGRYRSGLSRPLREMLAVLVDDADDALLDALVAAYLARYVEIMVEASPPCAGVVSMLDRLASAGIALAVLTNKTERNARVIVEANFGTRFALVVGAVPGRADKPAPDGARFALDALGVGPAETWLVGDSVIDLETARRAGLLPVGATWAIDAVAADALAVAALVARSPADLLAALGLEA